MDKLYVDIHEPERMVDYLEEMTGKETEHKSLKIGDYVYQGVCVERKEVTDFLNSIFKTSLFEQLLNMKKNYDKRFLIIHGDLEHECATRKSDVYMSVLGAITTISCEYETPVIITENDYEFAVAISNIIDSLDGKTKRPIDTVKATKPTYQIQENLVAQIPGVGLTRARDLLKQFGSVESLFRADKEELKKVDGVGDKTADNIKRILGDDYEMDKK